jgi:hypothetical protein
MGGFLWSRLQRWLILFLLEEARRFAEAAEKEIPGSLARELLLRRARQAETASRMNERLRSPGLKPLD